MTPAQALKLEPGDTVVEIRGRYESRTPQRVAAVGPEGHLYIANGLGRRHTRRLASPAQVEMPRPSDLARPSHLTQKGGAA